MKVNIFEKIDKNIFESISVCIEIANSFGFEIYLVGGIVRDLLLGFEIKDVDITVAGDAQKLAVLIGQSEKVQSVKINEKLPTAKIFFKNGVDIDLASTRQEKYNSFGELPTVVKVGCKLEEDVVRRDFTINSIAVSLNKNSLFDILDYLNGVEDLKNKKLRILHDKSFYDDSSRMIRGLKFAQRFGFSLEKNTLKLQNEYLANPLKNIPLERVKNELKDLFNLNKSECLEAFLNQKLYKIFINKIYANIIPVAIFEAAADFSVKKEDIWLLYFLPLFICEEPLVKLNLTSRELKIIKEISYLIKNHIIFNDKYSLYEYFTGKDYLTAVFYGIFNDKKSAEEYFKIKNIKK